MKGNFNQLIQSEQPVLVDFHAEWCGPCKAQAPILKEVSAAVSGQARVIKIDVDKNRALAQQYQIQGVPTLMLFKQGQALWRQSGMASKEQLVQVIQQHA